MTGERPLQGVTPDSLLALHDAGYRAVIERLGPGSVLDLGCGQGFESVRLGGPGRTVVGVDYSTEALGDARRRFAAQGLRLVAGDAAGLGLASAAFDWVCSSHLVEHFRDPSHHVRELARVLHPDGTAFVITPNAPADFENPFHLRLFRADELADELGRSFAEVSVLGIDGSAAVKADFDRRRAKAARLLRLDVFGLRHRMPRSWYIAVYTRALPLAYRLLGSGDSGGHSGIDAGDFFVTDALDDTTLVLFAVARRPRGRHL
ncbi:MAG TPA: class I SAM-dependent methyltransferase [Acidimicrobiales bacterium]|nr:class I SAM-dependent methyltransferase [Acidimicrobiales bacterium]